MNFKEKLEKAANQYEEESIYGGMEALYDTKYAFKQGAEWLQSQPIVDRLTEEERKNITPANRYILEQIFGKGNV